MNFYFEVKYANSKSNLDIHTKPDTRHAMAQRAHGGLLSAMGLTARTMGRQPAVFFVRHRKITILLCTLIFIISYIQSYFRRNAAKSCSATSTAFGQTASAPYWAQSRLLLVLFHSAVYRLYVRRTSGRRNVFLSDLFAHGRFGSLLLLMSIFALKSPSSTLCWFGRRRYRRNAHRKTAYGKAGRRLHFLRRRRRRRSAGDDGKGTPALCVRDRCFPRLKKFSVYPDRRGIGAVIHNWIPQDWIAAF